MVARNAIFKMLSIRSACVLALIGCITSVGQLAHAQSSASSKKTNETARNTKTSVRYISTSQAEVFAGPGEDFYPTAILKSGQSIEVLQETADGWLAITPPEGSFSWLPAAQGLLLPGGRVVEVTEKSAVSWIGSELGTAKQYRWQVKLQRGQQLAVIGEQSIKDSASGSQALWYKITPPPGELRWIQSKATSTESPAANVASAVEPAQSNETILDNQVVTASAQQPVNTGRAPRSNVKSRSTAGHQHTDRWADWHAMEFKNGSFSFPGVARMLGMQPPEPARTSTHDDPFDLTASYTRPRPNRAPSQPQANESLEALATELAADNDARPSASSMAVRQSRGWRDPRQLREERVRSGNRDQWPAPDETMLAATEGGFEGSIENADESSLDDRAVMDASFVDDGEIGSSVITAGATEPRRAPRSAKSSSAAAGSQSWFGIEQAPSTNQLRSPNLVQASLDDIQLELSTMVAGPEYSWNLAPLENRVRYFIEHGRDSIERGQARLLLERIESFQQIARHSAAVGVPSAINASTIGALPASATGKTNSPSAGLASWVAPQQSSAAGAGSDNSAAKFDATGWLVPVHSNGRDMPTHALTNDTGRIIVYVTPAPGVNLARFESQPIGVYGLRGYLPQLKTNHIQIERVVRLQ